MNEKIEMPKTKREKERGTKKRQMPNTKTKREEREKRKKINAKHKDDKQKTRKWIK